MKSEKKKNPMVAFVLNPNEFAAVKELADYFGVSIAQLSRGYLRWARKQKHVVPEVYKLGRM